MTGRYFLQGYVDAVDNAGTILLYLLMFLAGASAGMEMNIKDAIKKIDPGSIAIPFVSLAGSVLFTAIVFKVSGIGKSNELIVASAGMGYYSITSAIMLKGIGAAAGFYGFTVNYIRESITLVFAQAISKVFGADAVLAAGGATTMDTTLYPAVRAGGPEYALKALVNGIVLTVTVPPLLVAMIKWISR